MLMMGFTDPDEFPGQLGQELQLDKLKAIAVANDIDEEEFYYLFEIR